MKKFEKIFLKYYTKKELKKIKKTKLLIIGCGGLGTNIAKILTRAGFKNFLLIDFDIVEIENLNRQQFFVSQCGQKKVFALKNNLKKINPNIKVKTLVTKIDKEKLKNILEDKSIDVVIESVDDAETKKLIFETAIECGKKVVCASGVGGYGDCENIKIKRGENFSIVGDMKSCVKDYKPLSAKVSAVASIQADEVLRMVLKK